MTKKRPQSNSQIHVMKTLLEGVTIVKVKIFCKWLDGSG